MRLRNSQGCPWDIFICPIPIAIHASPNPWDVSHGIPLGMTFPWTNLEIHEKYLKIMNLTYFHPKKR